MTKLVSSDMEANIRRRVLKAVNENTKMADAARELGISRRTLYRYLEKWGLAKKQNRR